jgi:hypothetical protein
VSRVYQNPAVIALHDSPAHRQAEARAGLRPRVEPLEGYKDRFKIFGCDANAVIPDRKPPALILAFRRHMDAGRPVGMPVLDRIGDQVLEQQRQYQDAAETLCDAKKRCDDPSGVSAS